MIKMGGLLLHVNHGTAGTRFSTAWIDPTVTLETLARVLGEPAGQLLAPARR
jgi:hypothetical protein